MKLAFLFFIVCRILLSFLTLPKLRIKNMQHCHQIIKQRKWLPPIPYEVSNVVIYNKLTVQQNIRFQEDSRRINC
jgi:hypothetical protein